jgi:hypothetical protein
MFGSGLEEGADLCQTWEKPSRRSNAPVGKKEEGRVEKTVFEKVWTFRSARPS